MSKNYRGKSFKGQKQVNRDFSYADIRGVNFNNTILRNVNFTGAKAGLALHWLLILYSFSVLLAILSGVASAIASFAVGFTVYTNKISIVSPVEFCNLLSTLLIVLSIFIFLFTVSSKGFIISLGISLSSLIPFFIVGVLFSSEYFATIGASFFIGTTGLILTVASLAALALSAAIAMAVVEFLPKSIALVTTLVISVATATIFSRMQSLNPTIVLIVGLPETLIVTLVGNYIAWQALEENEKFTWIRNLAITIAITGGTSFRGADLTDANFMQARLKNTDFREANLTRTSWLHVKKINLSLAGKNYLKSLKIRQLLITRDGQGKNFDYTDLRGVNLQGANLQNASFIGANLSEANLQDANLSKAKLKQTQLDGANLTGACLTGACIEDWGITSETQLHGVQCDYIFMKLVEQGDFNENPRRKPDNWNENFKEGDFADLMAPLVKTLLELYHSQQVEPRAVQLAFNQLVENNPGAELSLLSVETRGKNNDKLLIKAHIGNDANASELSAEYFSYYNQYKSLSTEVLWSLLAEKDKTILMLAGQVDEALKTAIKRPSFYAENYHNQGDTMSDKSESSSYNLTGAKFGGGFAGTGGTQSGGIFNDYSSNPSLAEAAAEIQQLLQQLETTNPTATNADKRAVVNQAIDAIENNAALKARVIAALNSSGTEALKTAINHPLAKNMMPFIEELGD